jgi:purine nucleosidase
MDLWFDTDPGFDDWMAWALLEADPMFQLHGVSVVAGNAPLSVHAVERAGIKALHGFETPVYAGCDRPLAQAQVTAQDVLGADGMETTGPRLPEVDHAARRRHGVLAMIDCIRAHPGRITLLAVGR